jgi:hypothetical protein
VGHDQDLAQLLASVCLEHFVLMPDHGSRQRPLDQRQGNGVLVGAHHIIDQRAHDLIDRTTTPVEKGAIRQPTYPIRADVGDPLRQALFQVGKRSPLGVEMWGRVGGRREMLIHDEPRIHSARPKPAGTPRAGSRALPASRIRCAHARA